MSGGLARPLERPLVVGADGLIGQALMAHYAGAGLDPQGTSRRGGSSLLPLDLACLPPDWTPPAGIDAAFLTAAITSQAVCECQPDLARRVNVEAIGQVAERLVRAGAFVVFLSTSAVFDGSIPDRRPEEERRPTSNYGRLKVQAEDRILALGQNAAVVRVTKVIGPATLRFREWITALGERQGIRPFADLVFAPLSSAFVAAGLDRVAAHRLSGVLHLSGARDISYADAARHLARRLGVGVDLVQPVSRVSAGLSDDFAPSHTTLDLGRAASELGLTAPEPYEVLDQIFGWSRTGPGPAPDRPGIGPGSENDHTSSRTRLT